MESEHLNVVIEQGRHLKWDILVAFSEKYKKMSPVLRVEYRIWWYVYNSKAFCAAQNKSVRKGCEMVWDGVKGCEMVWNSVQGVKECEMVWSDARRYKMLTK